MGAPAAEQRIVEILDRHIVEGTFPGVVLLARRDGRDPLCIVRGRRQVHPDPEPMTEETLFDLASVTKPIATTVLTLQCLEELRLPVQAAVGRFVSPLHPAVAEATILEILTHASGLPATVDLQRHFPDPAAIDPEEAAALLRAVEPAHPRGTQVLYSCTGFLLLGLFLRAVTGTRPAALWASFTRDRPGLRDLLFLPSAEHRRRAAATEYCLWRKRWVRGEVHDESAFCMGGDGGNAGLFGTARSLLALLSALRSGGALGGLRVLSEESVRLMTTCQTGPLSPRRSAGFALQGPGFPFGPCFGEEAFGHTGFTGTSVLVDPQLRFEAVVLTNRVHLGRAETAERIVRFRAELHPQLYAALAERG